MTTYFFGDYRYTDFGWPLDGPIVKYTYKSVEFPGGVHRDTVGLWDILLSRVVPLIPGGLHAGWCWGYDNRPIRNGTAPSFHRGGLALDLNAPLNPYRADGTPGPHQMPDSVGDIARNLGMEWGGDWRSPKDYMHFEIHASPKQVHDLIVANQPHPSAPHFEAYQHMSPAKYGTRTLRLWNAGDDVRFVQNWIGSTAAGAPDGYFGPKTQDGVRWYQHMRGLPVDGIVGRQTWSQMEPR